MIVGSAKSNWHLLGVSIAHHVRMVFCFGPDATSSGVSNAHAVYTRKNAQVVTSLQTSCNKSVHRLSTGCVRTACP